MAASIVNKCHSYSTRWDSQRTQSSPRQITVTVFNSGRINCREAPVRFGSVTVWGWKGSSGSGFRFWRFLCKTGFSVFLYSLTGRDGSGFGSWKTVPAVAVPLSVSGKTVPTVPVSGSGSVPEPPCN